MAKGNGGTRGMKSLTNAGENLWMSSLLGYSLPDYVNGKDVNYQISVDATKLRRRMLIERDLYRGGDVSISFNNFVRDSNYPEQEVKTSNIISQQRYVKTDVVREYINNGEGIDSAPIIGFKVFGTDKVILVNGNHRVAAEVLKGRKTIKMIAINAPKEYFKELQ